MPTTLQPVISRNVLDFRGQETVQIEGRSCLTVAFKEHSKALGEFKSNPNAYPLAQMIVAWARYAENYEAKNGRVLNYSKRNYAWIKAAQALAFMTESGSGGFSERSLVENILGVMQSQGIDTENL